MTRPAVILLSGGLDSATAAAIARRRRLRPVCPLRWITASGTASNSKPRGAWPKALGVRAACCGQGRSGPIRRQRADRRDPSAQGPPGGRDGARHSRHLRACPKHGLSIAGLGLCRSRRRRPTSSSASTPIDYSGYPDCRAEFIAAFQRLANLATKAGVEGRLKFTIHTPLIRPDQGPDHPPRHRNWASITASPIPATTPTPRASACWRCDACQLRRKGFQEAGLKDPVKYRTTENEG